MLRAVVHSPRRAMAGQTQARHMSIAGRVWPGQYGRPKHGICQLQGVSVKDSARLHWLGGARPAREITHLAGNLLLNQGWRMMPSMVMRESCRGQMHMHMDMQAGRQDCWHSGSRQPARSVGRQCRSRRAFRTQPPRHDMHTAAQQPHTNRTPGWCQTFCPRGPCTLR